MSAAAVLELLSGFVVLIAKAVKIRREAMAATLEDIAKGVRSGKIGADEIWADWEDDHDRLDSIRERLGAPRQPHFIDD